MPEHLNWHADMDEYALAKAQLFAHQSADDIAIYFAANEASKHLAESGKARKIPYYVPPGAVAGYGYISMGSQTICRTDELKLLGRHNWQNVCAAVTAVWQVTQDVGAIRSVLTTFSGLPHRLEFVRELNGVQYYEDSFGTTPETAVAAIEAFDQPQVVILGGRPKGANYEELARVIAANQHVVKAMLIGEARPMLVKVLQAAGYRNYVTTDAQTMPEIVKQAAELGEAVAGSLGKTAIVLLSTACSSFDMFDNYKQRGEAFKQAVQALV